MTSSQADIVFPRPAQLARAMGRHFAHKVDVKESEGRTLVAIRWGEFELEPCTRVLHVRASAADEDGLVRVQQVASNHLRRLAHAPLAIHWSPGSTV